MTSNQVSYAIGSQQIAESSRHNKIAEQQEDRKLDLQAQQIENQNMWEKERNRLQDAYNTAYINYQNATLDWKTHYENEMLKIQGDLAAAEIMYKKDQTQIAQELNRIKQEGMNEQARHNREYELLISDQNWLGARQLEYQYDRTELENSTRQLELAQQLLIAREQMSNQLTISTAEIKQQEIRNTIEQREVNRKETEMYLRSLIEAVKAGVSAGSALLLGGRR